MQKFTLTLAVLNVLCAMTSLYLQDYLMVVNSLIMATFMFQIYFEKKNNR
jgi:hypothetical protein